MKPPIFIFGVPRSGTTLLRTILNCHPHIACGPEAPWLANHLPQSVMALQEMLISAPHGYCDGFQVPPAKATARIRELVDGLFTDFARQQGKIRWAHKTPDDSMFVAFFTGLFPDAKFIHLVRHPLDAALSNTKVSAHRAGISEWHEQNILLEAGCAVKKNLFNSVLRWRRWNERISRSLAGVDHRRIQYEDLVSQPLESFRALFAYLDEPFNPEILDYQKFPGILPDWEWGSADVKNAKAINSASVARWQRELSPAQATVLAALAGSTAAPVSLVAASSLAVADGKNPEDHELFRGGLDELAVGLGLPRVAPGSAGWAQGWLWLSGLDRLDWPKMRLVNFGRELSPLAWLAALLGAKVTMVESDPAVIASAAELSRRLQVNLDSLVMPDPGAALPFADASVDVVLASTGAAGSWPGTVEATRVLKPGGLLGVYFSGDSNDEFVRKTWLHAAFGQGNPPAWFQAGNSRAADGAALLSKATCGAHQ